jgi:hypothetical protein
MVCECCGDKAFPTPYTIQSFKTKKFYKVCSDCKNDIVNNKLGEEVKAVKETKEVEEQPASPKVTKRKLKLKVEPIKEEEKSL